MTQLWNCSLQILKTRFDGKPYVFAPGEKKVITEQVVHITVGDQDEERVYRAPAIINHILYKLGEKGVVLIPDGSNNDEIKKIKIDGLKKAQSDCVRQLLNFETLNEERKKQGLSKELPSETVMNYAKMKKQIDRSLDKESAEDKALLDEVMSGLKEAQDADKEISKITDNATDPMTSENNKDKPECYGNYDGRQMKCKQCHVKNDCAKTKE